MTQVVYTQWFKTTVSNFRVDNICQDKEFFRRKSRSQLVLPGVPIFMRDVRFSDVPRSVSRNYSKRRQKIFQGCTNSLKFCFVPMLFVSIHRMELNTVKPPKAETLYIEFIAERNTNLLINNITCLSRNLFSKSYRFFFTGTELVCNEILP